MLWPMDNILLLEGMIKKFHFTIVTEILCNDLITLRMRNARIIQLGHVVLMEILLLLVILIGFIYTISIKRGDNGRKLE